MTAHHGGLLDSVGSGRDARRLRAGPAVRRVAGPLWTVPLLVLGYSGYFKGNPLLAGLPFDLTAVSAALCVVGVLHQLTRKAWYDKRALRSVLGLWVLFAIGAVLAIGTDAAQHKVTLLYTVTLVSAAAPCWLLTSDRARRWWLYGTVWLAGAMGAGAVLMPDVRSGESGRLSLDGSTTILTARVIGAGIIVALVFALTRARRKLLWWAMAMAGLLAMLAVGSRGPVLALIVAMLAVILFGGVLKRRRTVTSIVTVAAGAMLAFVPEATSSLARRVQGLGAGDNIDLVREFLFEQAVASASHHPLGVGWGGFAQFQAVRLTYGDSTPYPHNLPLEIVVESGWIALAAFLVLAFRSMRGFVRASGTPANAALLGLGVYWLAVAQTSSDINGNRMTWITLTIGLTVVAEKCSAGARRSGPPTANGVTADDGNERAERSGR